MRFILIENYTPSTEANRNNISYIPPTPLCRSLAAFTQRPRSDWKMKQDPHFTCVGEPTGSEAQRLLYIHPILKTRHTRMEIYTDIRRAAILAVHRGKTTVMKKANCYPQEKKCALGQQASCSTPSTPSSSSSPPPSCSIPASLPDLAYNVCLGSYDLFKANPSKYRPQCSGS